MKNNKVFLIGGVGLGAWYLFDHLGKTGAKKSDSGKSSGGSSKVAPPSKEDKQAAKKPKDSKGGKWFDFFWGLIGDVTPTATDEAEWQGADLAKSGPFKGYRGTGYWYSYTSDPEVKRWLETSAGKDWTAKLQGYLKAAKKSGGKLTKAEVEATKKYVPLPDSAPTRKYKDAQGNWYYQKGDKIWKAQVFNPSEDADSLSDALRRQADALKGRHG